MNRRKGFTLIELLVVIAIIALLSSIIFAMLSTSRAKGRDARRLADLSQVSKAISVYETGAGVLSYGSSSIVYTSLPDTSSTCANWSLPALQSGWSYRCVASTKLRNTDGTGWIPIDLAGTRGDSFLNQLPLDPINRETGYYTYIPPQSGAQFVVAASKAESPTSNMEINSTGGFTLGAFSIFAAATGATSTSGGGGGGGPVACTTSTWNGYFWIPQVTCTSGGTVGTMTTYTGVPGNKGIAFDGVNMWTAGASTVSKITPSGTISSYGTSGSGLSAIAYRGLDRSDLWTADYTTGSVTKVISTGASQQFLIGGGTSPNAIAFDRTYMWTANWAGFSVSRVDQSGGVTTYTGLPGRPMGIAYDGTNMWVTIDNASVTKITSTGVMTNYPGTGASPNGIAFDGVNMWTANNGGNSVTKITPAGAMTTYTGTGAGPMGIAFDGTNMWVTNFSGASVTRVSPTGVMTTYTGTGTNPNGIAFDGKNMWVANSGSANVTKIVAR